MITPQGRLKRAAVDSGRRILFAQAKPLIRQAVNRLFADFRLRSGMARLFILLAVAALTYAVLLPGSPGGPLPIDPATAAAPAARTGLALPSLDLMSLGLGLIAGFIVGWVWQLPWRTVPELFREVIFRSIRGVGLIGLAMGAAAILLFY